MRKFADIETPLQPHQQRVVDRMRTQDGLVVMHGLGSGKTLTSLAVAEDQKAPTKVIVPAALQDNYKKELAKHVVSPKADYTVASLQGESLRAQEKRDPVGLLVVDEAHRARDPGTNANKMIRNHPASKRMLLTASGMYNRPYDLAALVNLAAAKPVFPGSQSDFDRQYIEQKKVDPGFIARVLRGVRPGTVPALKNVPAFTKNVRDWVDYHENSREGFPDVKEERVDVPISDEQRRIYDTVLGKAPSWVRYKVMKGLPPSKQESEDINAFLSAARQASVSVGGLNREVSPLEAGRSSTKLVEALKRLEAARAENPDHRALIYSHFLDAGLSPYEEMLKEKGIPYGKFTGDVSKAERDQMVRDYNEGRVPNLLVSSAGGEGLDLKGTRQIQVLDPHFNEEKIKQVIGRGVRYKSHEHLPEDQRNVRVERYMTVMPQPGVLGRILGRKRDGSTDEYLQMLSQNKERLNEQVREVLRGGGSPQAR